MVAGFCAEAFDHPAGGIGLADEGLAFVVLEGQGFLEVSDGESTFVVVACIEAFGEASDPVRLGL